MIKQTLVLRLAMIVSWIETSSLEHEEGQTLAEYALILALIAVAVIGAVTFLGGTISGLFGTVGSSI
jgi:pilus assembly protein Flp/PilA